MSLKKYLISYKGQVIMEYFILLTIMAIFTLLAGSYFFKKSKSSTEDFRDAAFKKMDPNVIILDMDYVTGS